MLMEKTKATRCSNQQMVFLIVASFSLLVSTIAYSYISAVFGLAGFSYKSANACLGRLCPPSSPDIYSGTNFSTTVEPEEEPEDDSVFSSPLNVPILADNRNSTSQIIASPSFSSVTKRNETLDPCIGKYIYVHQLPPKFNYQLLSQCETLSICMKDMCVYLQNDGFGPPIFENSTAGEGGFKPENWFATDQFTLEVIFHSRMKHYKCLTNDSSSANALFIPFYAALDAGRNIESQNTTVRDQASIELMNYISSLEEWKVMNGRDHFLVGGRIAWDFRRSKDNASYWGNKLMNLPQSANITMLTIESTTCHENEAGIPYPTYFHPSSSEEIREWQESVAREKRKYLFSFAGAPRASPTSIRGEVISQCLAAPSECGLISCTDTTDKKCQDPLSVLKLFRSSRFCLQPPGDSPTRRSVFDSIISGCVPVFFDLKSGPGQYTWYFGRNYTEYSVFIPSEDVKANKTDIRKLLSQIPEADVEAMRSEVIKMIPRVIYRRTNSEAADMEKDAFDVAVEGMLNRVGNLKSRLHI